MLKISRLTDYAVVLLTHMGGNLPKKTASASKLAEASGIPLPTVSKLLKIMAKAGLIKAKRGVFGGYEVLTDFNGLSLLKFIEIFEGPTHITDCLNAKDSSCQLSAGCSNRTSWHVLNLKIRDLLANIDLKDFLPKEGVIFHG